MKKIQYIAIAALMLFTTVSCNDEFMEKRPLDKINDGYYWKSVNDLKLYVNNLYNRNDLLARDDGWATMGPHGWDATDGSDTEIYFKYNTRLNGENTIPDNGNGWGTSDWEALRDINYFLDNYKKVEETAGEEAVKQYVGEALFFRAIFYFGKLKRYGDLPLSATTVTPTSEILYQNRSPRNEVVDFIMNDLDKAVNYLPARGSGSWNGRVTKETAMALQARIALYEGTWEKYHANDNFKAAVNQSAQFLEKAAKVSGDLITLSGTNGYPALVGVGAENGYRDLFNQPNYDSNKEVIFYRKYLTGASTNHWSGYSYCSGGRGASKNLIDSYLKLDGTPVAPGYDDATLLKAAEGRDPRLEQTIQINDGKHYVWEQANPKRYFIAPIFDGWDGDESALTGYSIYKGHNFRYTNSGDYSDVRNGLLYFRYGEVLLIYAEAKAELGTITQADLDKSINKLRERVGMPNMTTSVAIDPNFEFANLSPVIQAIRRERKVELACEGFRSDDIMRWAAAGELIAGKIPVGAKLAQWQGFKFSEQPLGESEVGRQEAFEGRIAGLVTDANGYIKPFKNTLNGGTEGYKFNVNRDYLYPIPTNQLTLNPDLKQNPGGN
ncbi:MAG: RagB/SusD family nutrient uptake outer membrane protein [Proteiniphilum sp.]|nr:RagB/SusD family nutrient uptake outer membrane protein [Proteiniphilum sp.]